MRSPPWEAEKLGLTEALDRKALKQPQLAKQGWEVESRLRVQIVAGTSSRGDLVTGGLITGDVDQQGSRKQNCPHIPVLNTPVPRMYPSIQELLNLMQM